MAHYTNGKNLLQQRILSKSSRMQMCISGVQKGSAKASDVFPDVRSHRSTFSQADQSGYTWNVSAQGSPLESQNLRPLQGTGHIGSFCYTASHDDQNQNCTMNTDVYRKSRFVQTNPKASAVWTIGPSVCNKMAHH